MAAVVRLCVMKMEFGTCKRGGGTPPTLRKHSIVVVGGVPSPRSIH